MRSITFLIAILALANLACEDVINVDLDSVEPRIVIEGNITEGWGPHLIQISRTTDYFEPAGFPPISGAVVTVSDNEGHVDNFSEGEPGFYYSIGIEGVPGRTYYLTVDIEGTEYSAVSRMPMPIFIDSLAYEYQEGDDFEDEGYILHCYFRDPPDVHDFCRFKVWENDELIETIYLYDGEWSDGNGIDFNFYWGLYEPQSEITVILMSIDEATLDYFLTLMPVEASEDGEFPHGVPANPNTNLTNGALGYFSAYAASGHALTLP